MSSQPTTEEREASILSKAGISAAYITLIIGYLFTILTTAHLTLLNFLVFSALQVCYSALLWWIIGTAWKSPKGWHTRAGYGATGSNNGSCRLPACNRSPMGLAALPGHTRTFFILLPLRIAISAGVLLYLTVVINLGWLDNWQWSQVSSVVCSLYFRPLYS